MSQQDQQDEFRSQDRPSVQGTPVDRQHLPVTTQPGHVTPNTRQQNTTASDENNSDNITGAPLKDMSEQIGGVQKSSAAASSAEESIAAKYQDAWRPMLGVRSYEDRRKCKEKMVALHVGFENYRTSALDLQKRLCDNTYKETRQTVEVFIRNIDIDDTMEQIGRGQPDFSKKLQTANDGGCVVDYKKFMENWIVYCGLSKSSCVGILQGIQKLQHDRREIETLTAVWKGFVLIEDNLKKLLEFVEKCNINVFTSDQSDIEKFAADDQFAMEYAGRMTESVPIPQEWIISDTYIYNKDDFSRIINALHTSIAKRKEINLDLAEKIRRIKQGTTDPTSGTFSGSTVSENQPEQDMEVESNGPQKEADVASCQSGNSEQQSEKIEVDSKVAEMPPYSSSIDNDATSGHKIKVIPENQYKEVESKWMEREEAIHKLEDEKQELETINQTLYQEKEDLLQLLINERKAFDEMKQRQSDTIQRAAEYERQLGLEKDNACQYEKQLGEISQEHARLKEEKTKWSKKYAEENDKLKRENERAIEHLKKQANKEIESKERLKQEKDKQIKKQNDDIARLKNESERMRKMYESRYKEKDNEVANLTSDYNKLYHELSAQQQVNYHKQQQNEQLAQLLQMNQNHYRLQEDNYQAKIAEQKAKLIAAEEEKEKLLTRLSKIAGAKLTQGNAGITDLSDQNRPMKVAEKYSELYDNEWTDALEELLDHGDGISDAQGIAILLEIVLGAYSFCCKMAEEYSQGIMLSVTCLPTCQTLSDSQQVQLTDEHKQMLEDIRKTLSPQLVQSVEEKYVVSLRDILLKYFGKKTLVPVRGTVKPQEKMQLTNTNVQHAESSCEPLLQEELSKPRTEEDDSMDIDGNDYLRLEEANMREQQQTQNNIGHSTGEGISEEHTTGDEPMDDAAVDGGHGNDCDNINNHLHQEETFMRGLQSKTGISTQGIPEEWKTGKDVSTDDHARGCIHGNEMDGINHLLHQEEAYMRKHQDLQNKTEHSMGTMDSNVSTGEGTSNVSEEELMRQDGTFMRDKYNTENKENPAMNEVQQNVKTEDWTSVGEETKPKEERPADDDFTLVEALTPAESDGNQDHTESQDQEQGYVNIPFTKGAIDELALAKRKQAEREEYMKKEANRSVTDRNVTQIYCQTIEENIKHEVVHTESSTSNTKGIPDHLSNSTPGQAGGARPSDLLGLDSPDTSHTEPEMKEVIELDSSFEKINDFGKKCANLCWMMRVREPPIHMEYDVQLGSELDTDFFKHYTQSGKIVKFLVWPALFLHKNGALLAKGVVQPMKKKEEMKYKSEQQQKS